MKSSLPPFTLSLKRKLSRNVFMTHKKLHTILMVEDEEDIQTVAQIALEDIGGFDMAYCNSGKCALEKAPNLNPDLILLDVMMPGMDGVTTYNELRKFQQLKQTPIIFMTAKVQASEIEQYIRLGALGVIAKPFDPMTLSNELNVLWEKNGN